MRKPRTCPIRTQKDAFWTQKDAFWTPKSALRTRVRRTNGQVFQKKAQHYRTRRIWFREVFSEKAFKKGPLETPGIYIYPGRQKTILSLVVVRKTGLRHQDMTSPSSKKTHPNHAQPRLTTLWIPWKKNEVKRIDWWPNIWSVPKKECHISLKDLKDLPCAA